MIFNQDLFSLLCATCIIKISSIYPFSTIYLELIDIPEFWTFSSVTKLRRCEHRFTAGFLTRRRTWYSRITVASVRYVWCAIIARVAVSLCDFDVPLMPPTCLFVIFSVESENWRITGFCPYSRIQPVFMTNKRKCTDKTATHFYNSKENISPRKSLKLAELIL